ncbi:esterase [Prevotella sp. oral taxon 820]|nr:esterase [Prevotella sp. oral taxon 820]
MKNSLMAMKHFLRQGLLLLLMAAGMSGVASAQEERLDSARINGHMRYFKMVIPQGIQADAPLVVVLHGYGSTYLKKKTYMRDAAKTHGFALCVPDGLRDPKGKRGWNVGYPQQEGWKEDDVADLCKLAAHVQRKYNLSRQNTFLTGMSNGGDICYLSAYRNQTTFKALASVSGQLMEWIYKGAAPQRRVPFMEIHGTADPTSRFGGDIKNADGWGKYLPVAMAVNAMVAHNRCTVETIEKRNGLTPDNGHSVTIRRYTGGDDGCDVWFYEIEGARHSWHQADINTGEEIWKFFTKYLR